MATPPPTKTHTKRLDFVDSLRGLAALYVILFHMVLVPTTKLILPKWLEPLIMNGGTGVTLFFIISAFTLCYTLQFQRNENNYLRKFYLRRIFRILPLYYVLLIVSFGLTHSFRHILHYRYDLLLYSTFGYNFVPGKQEGLVWASWTLGVEMVFYAIFPFIFYLVKSLKHALMFLIVTLVLAWVNNYLIEYLISANTISKGSFNLGMSFFFQLPVFATGIVCYYLHENYFKGKLIDIKYNKIILFVGLILFFALPYFVFGTYFKGSRIYVMAVVYSMIFLGLSKVSIKLIVNKFTVFLGAISYSTYLNHPRIVYSLNKVYVHIYNICKNESVSILVCSLVTLAFLIPISYITYRIIETPLINYGRNLIKKMK